MFEYVLILIIQLNLATATLTIEPLTEQQCHTIAREYIQHYPLSTAVAICEKINRS